MISCPCSPRARQGDSKDPGCWTAGAKRGANGPSTASSRNSCLPGTSRRESSREVVLLLLPLLLLLQFFILCCLLVVLLEGMQVMGVGRLSRLSRPSRLSRSSRLYLIQKLFKCNMIRTASPTRRRADFCSWNTQLRQSRQPST